MVILELIVRFQLPACHSLKEKRRRLSGLRQRFGRETGIAVAESGLQNSHDRSEWTFLILANNKALADSTSARIETFLHEAIDGFVTDIWRDFLL